MDDKKAVAKRDVIKAVDVWKKRLGLDIWAVKVDEDPNVGVNEEAEIGIAFDYSRATIKIPLTWKNWSRYKMNEVVVHELSHILLHKYRLAALDAGEMLGSEASQLYRKRLDHEMEVAIDVLTGLFLDNWGEDGLV